MRQREFDLIEHGHLLSSWLADWKLWFIFFKQCPKCLSRVYKDFAVKTSTRSNQLQNMLTLIKRHTTSSERATADGRWKSFKRSEKSGGVFWIIVVCVVIVVPYVQVGYLSSFPNHTWRRDPVVCNRFQNGLESSRPGARAARLRAHWGVFDKVLCIKVTITFITDVVYIFDILMFILFCERREYI